MRRRTVLMQNRSPNDTHHRLDVGTNVSEHVDLVLRCFCNIVLLCSIFIFYTYKTISQLVYWLTHKTMPKPVDYDCD